MSKIIDDDIIAKYVLIVGTRVITNPTTRHLIEYEISKLSEDERAIARIVPVDSSGKEILFG